MGNGYSSESGVMWRRFLDVATRRWFHSVSDSGSDSDSEGIAAAVGEEDGEYESPDGSSEKLRGAAMLSMRWLRLWRCCR